MPLMLSIQLIRMRVRALAIRSRMPKRQSGRERARGGEIIVANPVDVRARATVLSEEAAVTVSYRFCGTTF